MNQKWKMLFIKESASKFSLETNLFDELFDHVDIVEGRDQALQALESKEYDLVVADLSVRPEEIGLLKQIKDKELDHAIFGMVLPKDADKLFAIADLGINAFELTPEQFEQALEALANFNPYENK